MEITEDVDKEKFSANYQGRDGNPLHYCNDCGKELTRCYCDFEEESRLYPTTSERRRRKRFKKRVGGKSKRPVNFGTFIMAVISFIFLSIGILLFLFTIEGFVGLVIPGIFFTLIGLGALGTVIRDFKRRKFHRPKKKRLRRK